MAAKRAAAGGTGKRRARRTGAETPVPNAARPPDRERRFVDVDPWALLLEQLTGTPEEGVPVKRKSDKGRVGQGPISRPRRCPRSAGLTSREAPGIAAR
jgi:hypothetical protein